MLSKLKTLTGRKIVASDGDIGTISEFIFDDMHYAIRYVVIDSGSWLVDRQVLLSPYALDDMNISEGEILTKLSRQQLESSPTLLKDAPITKQYEASYYGYYGYPLYWGGPYMWGINPYIEHDSHKWIVDSPTNSTWDPHLRSTKSLNGYIVHSKDGNVGHISDYIIDESNWAIRYVVVDSGSWLSGQKVLVSTNWIERISATDSTVQINMLKEEIMRAPKYDDETIISQGYETDLHRHYNRQGYWVDQPARVPTAAAGSSFRK